MHRSVRGGCRLHTAMLAPDAPEAAVARASRAAGRLDSFAHGRSQWE
jgi:hypothetical protein